MALLSSACPVKLEDCPAKLKAVEVAWMPAEKADEVGVLAPYTVKIEGDVVVTRASCMNTPYCSPSPKTLMSPADERVQEVNRTAMLALETERMSIRPDTDCTLPEMSMATPGGPFPLESIEMGPESVETLAKMSTSLSAESVIPSTPLHVQALLTTTEDN